MAIPDPEPGLVVHFNYLWSSEFDRGREEARYPRPCAIVLSYRRTADGIDIVDGRAKADERGLTEADVVPAVREVRKERRARPSGNLKLP